MLHLCSIAIVTCVAISCFHPSCVVVLILFDVVKGENILMFLVSFILLLALLPFCFSLCYMSGGAIINYLTSSKRGRLKPFTVLRYMFFIMFFRLVYRSLV